MRLEQQFKLTLTFFLSFLFLNTQASNCSPNEVIGFSLVEAGTTNILGTINNGDTINLYNLPEINIIANVCDESAVGSVEFLLDGNTVQVENISPYAIAGDKGGEFKVWNAEVGSFTLQGIPYSSGNTNGTLGVSHSISFVIIDQAVIAPPKDCNGVPGGSAFLDDCGVCAGGNTGVSPNADKDSCGVCFGDGSSCATTGCNPNEVTTLMLMNAGTGGAIRPLHNNDTINLKQLPDFSIRADVCDEQTVESVEFFLNGNSIQLENIQPYSIAGDKGGSYTAWNPGVGSYTLHAVPYTGGNGSGTKGSAYVINFEIVNSSTTLLPKDCNGDAGGSAFLDDCGVCVGGNTGKTANADKDSCGVCFGDGSSCAPATGCTGNEVTALDLMHAGTLGKIKELSNWDTINLQQYSNFSIVAKVCDDNAVESVEFVLDGNSIQLENIKPYSIAGDKSGDYTAWNPGVGSYTLKAIPYSNGNGGGNMGVVKQINIVIVNSTTNNQTADCNGDVGGTAFLDDCGICSGGNTGITPNADKDSCGVCFGDGSSCSSSPSTGCTNFPGGRIAMVSDGNVADEDDWGATAFALAMIHYAAIDNSLVFVGHSCIWKNKNLSWEEEMDTSTYGTMLRFGMDTSIVHSFRRDLTGSVNALTAAIDASTSSSPLWIYGAGPMDVIYRALNNAQSSKIKYVNLISHSSWNETSKYGGLNYNLSDILNAFSSDGLNLYQIQDQNTSNGHYDFRAEDENKWDWMYNSGNPDFVWLRNRNCDACLGDFDISDAGMIYWLLSGGPNGGCETCGTIETEFLFKNPCPSLSNKSSSRNGNTSLNTVSSVNSVLTVYPNPSNGAFNLELPQEIQGKGKVFIYNQMGALVYQSEINSNTSINQINTSLRRGMYILRFVSGDFEGHARLIFE